MFPRLAERAPQRLKLRTNFCRTLNINGYGQYGMGGTDGMGVLVVLKKKIHFALDKA